MASKKLILLGLKEYDPSPDLIDCRSKIANNGKEKCHWNTCNTTKNKKCVAHGKNGVRNNINCQTK